MKLGLGNKIVLIIELAIFVTAVLGGAVAAYVGKNTLIDLTNSQIQSVSVLKEYSVKRYINHSIEEIKHASADEKTHEALIGLLQGKIKSGEKEITDILKDFVAVEGVYSGGFVIDAKGVIVASADPLDEGKIQSDKTFFLNAQKEPAVHDFYYNATTEKPELIVTTPIFGEKGIFAGVLAIKIKLEDISTIMSEKSGLGQTGESFLVNSSNLVVTELLKEPGVTFKKTVYIPQVKDCLKGNSVLGLRTDYHGDEVFGYWRWFPEIKSCLVTKIDSSEVLAPVLKTELFLLITIGIVGLFIGIIGYLFGRTVTSPLRELRDIAIRIKQGDLKVRANINTKDEIGDLAAVFNEMTGHLSSYTENLKEEVKTRTSELEKTKTGLEKTVAERTSELEKVKIGLEKTVAERTRELNEKLAEAEEMNNLIVGRELKMVELKNEIAVLKGQRQ